MSKSGLVQCITPDVIDEYYLTKTSMKRSRIQSYYRYHNYDSEHIV